jgi:hypothetical protein
MLYEINPLGLSMTVMLDGRGTTENQARNIIEMPATLSTQENAVDVFYGAVNIQGLPVAVILDANSPAESRTKIIEMLEKLSIWLVGSNFTNKQIKSHIQEQYEKLDNSLRANHGARTTFSAVVVYKDSSSRKMKSISFGTGNTKVVLANSILPGVVIEPRNTNDNGNSYRDKATSVENLKIDIRGVQVYSMFQFISANGRVLEPYMAVPTPQRQIKVQKFLYDQAVYSFNEMLEQIETNPICPNGIAFINQFIDQIETLSQNQTSDIASLTKAIIKTNAIIASYLNNSESLSQDFDDYRSYIKNAVGSKILYDTMKALSSALQYDQARKSLGEKLEQLKTIAATNTNHDPNPYFKLDIYRRAIIIKTQIEAMHRDPLENDIASLTEILTIKTNAVIYSYLNRSESLSQDISDYHSYLQSEVSGKLSSLPKMLGDAVEALDIGLQTLLYNQAVMSFDDTLSKIKDPDVEEKAIAFKNQIVIMRCDRSNPDITSLARALTETNYVITSFLNKKESLPEDIHHYQSYIQTEVNCKLSLPWRILRRAMIALGIALVVIRGLIIKGPIGACSFVPTAIGVGMFSKNHAKRVLNEKMESLTDIINEKTPNPKR